MAKKLLGQGEKLRQGQIGYTGRCTANKIFCGWPLGKLLKFKLKLTPSFNQNSLLVQFYVKFKMQDRNFFMIVNDKSEFCCYSVSEWHGNGLFLVWAIL